MDALTLGERVAIEFGLKLFIQERQSLIDGKLPSEFVEAAQRQLSAGESALKKVQEAEWTL